MRYEVRIENQRTPAGYNELGEPIEVEVAYVVAESLDGVCYISNRGVPLQEVTYDEGFPCCGERGDAAMGIMALQDDAWAVLDDSRAFAEFFEPRLDPWVDFLDGMDDFRGTDPKAVRIG